VFRKYSDKNNLGADPESAIQGEEHPFPPLAFVPCEINYTVIRTKHS